MPRTGLPPNVRTILRAQATVAHNLQMIETKANIATAGTQVRLSSGRMLDEGSPANAAAVAKILRLPG